MPRFPAHGGPDFGAEEFPVAMKVVLEPMGVGPDRDVAFFYHGEAWDDAGQRYALRLITQAELAATIRHKLGVETLRPIVEAAYRTIIPTILAQLRPGYGHVSWIYLAMGAPDDARD